jgi:predicted transposase YbfD/YdcC
VSAAAVEPDALPFPSARQVFDSRNTTTFKKDSKTTHHTRYFVTSLTSNEAGDARLGKHARGQWSVENPNHWRRDALWGEDRCRLRNKNAACALALLRTTLLRVVLRCGWGTTKQVFERVAARPSLGLDLLAKRTFPG